MEKVISKNDDMDRKELEVWALENGITGFSHSKINNNFILFCEDYNLDPALFYKNVKYKNEDKKQEEYKFKSGTGLTIKSEWKDIFLILLKSYSINPFVMEAYDVENGKVNFKSIDKYYDVIIKMIEELPNSEEKYSIAYTSPYFRTKLESHVIKLVKEKIKQFSAATSCISFSSKIELWINLYQALDSLIYNAYELDIQVKDEHIKKVEEVKKEWSIALKAELKELLFQMAKGGNITGDIFKRAKSELTNSVSAISLETMLNVLEKDFLYKQEKNISEVLVEKLKERMILFPVNPNFYTEENPNITPQLKGKQKKDKVTAENSFQNIAARKKEFGKIIKDSDVGLEKGTENNALENISDFNEVLEKKKEKLLENQDEELKNKIESINNLEVGRTWVNKALQTGEYEGDKLTEEDRQHLTGYLIFLDKVESKSREFSSETTQLIEEPMMNQYFKTKNSNEK